jgi:phosphoglycerate dehydrogenase-like enzyme
MKPTVLFDPFPRPRARIFNAEQWDRFNAVANIIETGDGRMADEMVERWLPEVTAIVGQTALPRDRLDRAAQLRAVINVEGNFLQNIDYDACLARGIPVLSIGPAFATPVAEMCLALALDLARGVTAGDRAMREGTETYGMAACADAVMLSGARVGIIGYGNIGRALRRMLSGFRAHVSVYDPWLPDNVLREDDTHPMTLEELLTTSQFIIVLAGVTSENQGFLDRAKLELIPPQSILILGSRAAVIDFDAFVELANAGRFRAATDVFPSEPVDPGHGVRQSRLLLSSHRAGGGPTTSFTIGEMVIDDLNLILQGLPPVRLQAARRETVSRMRSLPGRAFAAPASSNPDRNTDHAKR